MRSLFDPARICVAAAAFLAASPALAFSDFGSGRPVTERDLAGKKICWQSGRWTFYGKDGHALNSQDHEFRWSVPTPGVLAHGYRRTQTEVLADGRVHTYHYVLRSKNHDRDGWGDVCK